MPVPADIRAVPRPVNNIVDDNGGDSPKRYDVQQHGWMTCHLPGVGQMPQRIPRPMMVIGYIPCGLYSKN